MALVIKPLTNTEVEAAKYREKDYKLFDGNGLFLFVSKNKYKVWRFRYKRLDSAKQTDITIGRYPHITLADARRAREEYLSQIANSIDPRGFIENQKKTKAKEQLNTFGKVAKSWFAYRKERAHFSPQTAKDAWRLIEKNLFPLLENTPISEITAFAVIEGLKPLQERGNLETLKRSLQKLNEIMTFALHRGLINSNPTQSVSKEFDSPQVEHMKSIKPEDISEFLKTLFSASITKQTRYLILWQLLTLVRPSEAATARWEAIDEQAKTWTLYIKKGITESDKGRVHVVTLSEYALKILSKLRKLNINSEYLFTSFKYPKQHIHQQTANAAIKRMGYKGKLVAHGLRSIASTVLNEQGFNSDVIEIALSHVNQDRIRMAYNRADYLQKRFEMLNWWAEYLNTQYPLII